MDETEKKILEAAGKVFAEKGFQAATVREICAAAGVNVAAVNYHFGDKERLYVEAVKTAHCAAEGPPPIPPEMPPEAKLAGFIGKMMESMWDHERPSWQAELVMREMARPSDACLEVVRDNIGPKFAALLAIIDELTGPGLPPDVRRRLGFSIVGQCLLYRHHRPIGLLLAGKEEYESYTAESLAKQIATFSLAGIKAVAKAQRTKPSDAETVADYIPPERLAARKAEEEARS